MNVTEVYIMNPSPQFLIGNANLCLILFFIKAARIFIVFIQKKKGSFAKFHEWNIRGV